MARPVEFTEINNLLVAMLARARHQRPDRYWDELDALQSIVNVEREQASLDGISPAPGLASPHRAVASKASDQAHHGNGRNRDDGQPSKPPAPTNTGNLPEASGALTAFVGASCSKDAPMQPIRAPPSQQDQDASDIWTAISLGMQVSLITSTGVEQRALNADKAARYMAPFQTLFSIAGVIGFRDLLRSHRSDGLHIPWDLQGEEDIIPDHLHDRPADDLLLSCITSLFKIRHSENTSQFGRILHCIELAAFHETYYRLCSGITIQELQGAGLQRAPGVAKGMLLRRYLGLLVWPEQASDDGAAQYLGNRVTSIIQNGNAMSLLQNQFGDGIFCLFPASITPRSLRQIPDNFIRHIAGQICSRVPNARAYCDTVLECFYELQLMDSSKQFPTIRLETENLALDSATASTVTSLQELFQPVQVPVTLGVGKD